jgi:DNA-binding beta-propeller fold protein YncE
VFDINIIKIHDIRSDPVGEMLIRTNARDNVIRLTPFYPGNEYGMVHYKIVGRHLLIMLLAIVATYLFFIEYSLVSTNQVLFTKSVVTSSINSDRFIDILHGIFENAGEQSHNIIPTAFAISLDGVNSNQAAVTNKNTKSELLLKNIKVGNDPRSIAFNPITKMIYVVNQSALSVINGSTDKILDFSLGTYAVELSAVAVNPNTNIVYVGALVKNNDKYHSVSPGIIAINGTTNKVLHTIPIGVISHEVYNLYLWKSYDNICHVCLDNILKTKHHLPQSTNPMACRWIAPFFLALVYSLQYEVLAYLTLVNQDNIAI